MRLLDAHNHLLDERFAGVREDVLAGARAVGVVGMVVNATREAEWEGVARLARERPGIIPAFGLHPWHLGGRAAGWRDRLERLLDATPGATVGEIGIDSWITGQSDEFLARRFPALGGRRPEPLEVQEEVFVSQLRIASERGLPASIHCLRAWDRMTALLRSGSRPVRGFLLHSYGGPAERIPELADMGAYFGFPGYFLGPRKAERSAVFRDVPPGRLLVETDAPDQLLPPELRRHGLKAADGAELNHPAELGGVYAGLAEVRGECVETLAARVEENFKSLFRHGWEPGMPGPD